MADLSLTAAMINEQAKLQTNFYDVTNGLNEIIF